MEIGKINLLYDQQLLSGLGVRRDYALLYLTKNHFDWAWSFFSKYDVDSRSNLAGVNFTAKPGDSITYLLSLNTFVLSR